MMKVASLCFEVCYPQRNALSAKKSKTKTGKIHHVSQDICHLHEIPCGKELWDTIRSSSGKVLPTSHQFCCLQPVIILLLCQEPHSKQGGRHFLPTTPVMFPPTTSNFDRAGCPVFVAYRKAKKPGRRPTIIPHLSGSTLSVSSEFNL